MRARDADSARRPRTLHEHRFAAELLRPSHLLLRSRLLFVAGIIGTVALGLLAAFRTEWLLRIDRPVSAALNDEAWVPFFRVVTEVGRPWAVALLSVIGGVVMWRRCRTFAIALPATAFTGMIVDVVFKLLVGRTRPPFGIGATEDPTSFPSGHVVLGVVVLGLLVPSVYVLTERRWAYWTALGLFFAYVPIVMLSRIVIGAHWLTDVIGSFFIGATLLLGAEYLVGSRLAHDRCDCRLHARDGTPVSAEEVDPAIPSRG
jgi:undecaprenyl-diphosphatase